MTATTPSESQPASASATPRSLPTADQIAQLGHGLARIVPPEWEDENGHVNICHHYAFHMETSIAFFARLGMSEAYLTERGQSTFTVEQNIRFHDEVLVGHEIAGYVRLLDLNAKLVHGVSVILNLSTGTVANTSEFIEGHVDLATRRTTPWSEELAGPLAGVLAEHRGLDWTLPPSTGLKLRHRDRSGQG